MPYFSERMRATSSSSRSWMAASSASSLVVSKGSFLSIQAILHTPTRHLTTHTVHAMLPTAQNVPTREGPMRTQDLIVRPTSPNGWGKAALWIFVLTLAGLIWTVGLASWASAEARAATSCESKPGFYIKSFTASRGEVTCTYERLAPPQTAPTASQQADTSRAARLQQA